MSLHRHKAAICRFQLICLIHLVVLSSALLLPRKQGLSINSRVLLAAAQQADHLALYGLSSQEVLQNKTSPTTVHFAMDALLLDSTQQLLTGQPQQRTR